MALIVWNDLRENQSYCEVSSVLFLVELKEIVKLFSGSSSSLQ